MTWTWQLLQAVNYLHRHNIGHRDISMENVLLSNGMVRLMDFGQAVRTHSESGTLLRYFNGLGKPYYRPPECHCPPQNTVEVHVPAGAQPGEVAFVRTVTGDIMCEVLLPSVPVLEKVCMAEPWGYAAAPVDVFACGVCMFIMATGRPPWTKANLSCQHFRWVYQCGIANLVKHRNSSMPAGAIAIMVDMVKAEPGKRPSVEQCLAHPWFAPLSGMTIPVHPWAESECKATLAGSTNANVDHCGVASVGESAVEYDPYKMEAVCRSVAGLSTETSHGLGAFGAVLAGDFYNMQEDTVVRSAAPPPPELSLQRFSAADVPPEAPTMDSFTFEPTTFRVSSKKPSEVANHLVEFLAMGVGAVIQKTSVEKFTIKADVAGEDGDCTLKVRLYKEGDDVYAVEFQRRSGESRALHKVFDMVYDQ